MTQASSDKKTFFSAFLLFFIASIYPFVSFFEHNIGETYYFFSILSVWAIMLTLGVGAIFFTTKIFPKWPLRTSALIWGISLILLFSFHHIEKITADLGISLGTIKILIWLGLVFAFAILSYIFAKSDKSLTVISFVLIGVNLAPISSIALALYNKNSLYNEEASVTSSSATAVYNEIASKPNVYWLVLDMYARQDVLQDEYNFDNSSFLAELEKHGFYVADKSYSNLNSTKLSLSTTLSMDYYLPIQEEINPAIWQAKVQGDNAVVHKFKDLGYNYIHVEPGGNTLKTRCGGGEDLCIHGPQSGTVSLNEAHIGLLQLTPFYRIVKNLELDIFSFDFTRIENVIENLDPSTHAPFFMFAHILSPHPPSRFDSDCKYLDKTEWELLGEHDDKAIENYPKDINCLNQRVLEFIKWVEQNDKDALVIIQADHGSFLHNPLREFTPSNIVNKSYWHEPLAILNAYRLPEECSKNLYETISPINNFPLIFSCIEGVAFEPKEDRSFIQYRKPVFEKFHEEIYEVVYESSASQ